jgi:hypothetical protein
LSDNLRVLPRLKFEAKFIAPHRGSAAYNNSVLL